MPESWIIAESFKKPEGGPRPPEIAFLAALQYAKEGWYYRITRVGETEWVVRVRGGRIRGLSQKDELLVELLVKYEHLMFETSIRRLA